MKYSDKFNNKEKSKSVKSQSGPSAAPSTTSTPPAPSMPAALTEEQRKEHEWQQKKQKRRERAMRVLCSVFLLGLTLNLFPIKNECFVLTFVAVGILAIIGCLCYAFWPVKK